MEPQRLVQRRMVMEAGLSLVAAAVTGAGTVRAAPAETSSEMRIQRLSWAALKIEVGRTTVLIDPLLDPSQLGNEKSFATIETRTEHRFALITHLHADHYDSKTIKTHLSDKGFVICHRSMAATVAADGLRVRAVWTSTSPWCYEAAKSR